MALWHWCQQTLCCHRHQHISHTAMYSAQHLTAMRTDRHTVTVTLKETTPACAVKQTKNQHVLISTVDWSQDLYMPATYSTTEIYTQLCSDTRHHASDISFTRFPGSDIHIIPVVRSGVWVAVFKSQCLNFSICTWPLSWLSDGDHLLNFSLSPMPSLPVWTTSVPGTSFLCSPLSLVDAYSVISWTCFHHGYHHHLTTYTVTGSGRSCGLRSINLALFYHAILPNRISKEVSMWQETQAQKWAIALDSISLAFWRLPWCRSLTSHLYATLSSG